MKRKVRFPPTREEIERYYNMSFEEKQLRHKIAIEKAHFNSVESIARHRLELDAYSSKKYREIVGNAEERMEDNLEVLENQLQILHQKRELHV